MSEDVPAQKRFTKIGLLGGTFDPPHFGHLSLARAAMEQLELDAVLFMPVGQPVHKADAVVTPERHRLAMLALAIDGVPGFAIDLTDMKRDPPHPTFSLLPLMKAAYPTAHLWLIIGADSLRDLPTWRNPQQIIDSCRLAVMPRPGVDISWDQLTATFTGIETAVDMLDGPTLSISSTTIKARLRNGETVDPLLPAAVLSYIKEKGLYRQRRAGQSGNLLL